MRSRDLTRRYGHLRCGVEGGGDQVGLAREGQRALSVLRGAWGDAAQGQSRPAGRAWERAAGRAITLESS